MAVIQSGIDLDSGEIRWDVEQIGGRGTWAGVLSTDGGLVFYGDDSGAFAALQATGGEPLWNFQLNVQFRGSPMTYSVNGRQYVAVNTGSGSNSLTPELRPSQVNNLFVFALP